MTAVRRSVVIVVVLALLAAVPAASAKAPGILYAFDAKRGALVQTSAGHRLSLPAATRVTWFTDRPERRAGVMTLRGLASIWQASGFAADPPNAAVILTVDGQARTHVVELLRPKAVGTSVSFALRVVPSASAAGFRHADGLASGTYRRVAVFIDDAATSPCLSSISTAASTSTTCLLSSSPAGSTTIYPPRSTSKSSSTTTQTMVSACASGSAFTLQVAGGYVSVPACGQGSAAFMLLTVSGSTMPSPQSISNVLMLPNGTTAQSPSAIVLTVSTASLVSPPTPPPDSSSPSQGVTLVGVTTVSSTQ